MGIRRNKSKENRKSVDRLGATISKSEEKPSP